MGLVFAKAFAGAFLSYQQEIYSALLVMSRQRACMPKPPMLFDGQEVFP